MKLKELLLCTMMASLGSVAYAAPGSVSIEKFKKQPLAFAASKPADKDGFFVQKAVQSPTMLNTASSDFQLKTSTWGFLTSVSGASWLYSQSFTKSAESQYSYASSDIVIYDENNVEQCRLKVETDENEYVNGIQPFGTITEKFFDNDASTWEVMVYLHMVDDNHNTKGEIRAYNNKGELVRTYEANNAFFFDASEGWNTYQRVLLEKMVTTEVDGVSKQEIHLEVLKPGGWESDAPVTEHTFVTEFDLVNYSNGAYMKPYRVGDDIYYVLSYYEKPYFEPSDDIYSDPIPTPDNHYLLDIYDKNYEKVSTISVPVQASKGALYGFRSFGLFSNSDLLAGDYSNDGKLNVIVSQEDYVVSSDSYIYSFEVYDEDSQKVAHIGSNIVTWYMMSDIEGESKQVALMQDVNGAELIQMVDIPSCEVVTTFSGIHDGVLLSTNVDRYPNGDSYQYAFGIGQGFADADNNVIAKIGWYNKDNSLDHFVEFNLGQDGEYFTPYITGAVLNPYMFNTDDQHEYIYIAKIKNQETLEIEDNLCIANEKGEVLYQYAGNDEIGDLRICVIYDDKITPKMLVGYYKYYENEYNIDLYTLPLAKFNGGGDGSAASPYVISTVGDLQQVKYDLDANYILGNDIDMSDSGFSWTPIDGFMGNLDGKNHSLKNMKVNSSDYNLGLFGNVFDDSGSGKVNIKNITFIKPEINVSEGAMAAGVLCGAAKGVNIDNIHVFDAVINSEGAGNTAIGGIAGQLTLYSKISSSSLTNLSINAPSSKNVGGIVGDMRTSAEVTASRVNGTVVGGTNVGGIVGTARQSTISNSYADVDIVGKNMIGGIVGDATRGLVTTSYVKGTITANEPSSWNGFCVGGVAGSLDSDWSQLTNDTAEPVISNTVVALSEINLSDAEVAKNTVHRIVGRSLIDEEWYEGETPVAEKGLVNNYANAALALNGVEAAGNTTEGADKNLADMDKAFFEGVGFVYGEEVTAPWKGEGMPVLYFEEKAQAIDLDVKSVSLEEGQTFELTATVWGTDAAAVEFSVSDAEVLSISAPTVDGNTAVVTVTCLKEGTASVIASVDGVQAVCTVSGYSGVESVVANGMNIRFDGNALTAEGAERIELYSLQGAKMASVKGDYMEVSVGSGLYIAVATGADGKRGVLKIVVK